MTSKHASTVAELDEKRKGALRELERVTGMLYKAQDTIKEQSAIIEEKKFTQQLAGWAIDRALETAKLTDSGIHDAKTVILAADMFAKWVTESSASIKAPERNDETLQ